MLPLQLCVMQRIYQAKYWTFYVFKGLVYIWTDSETLVPRGMSQFKSSLTAFSILAFQRDFRISLIWKHPKNTLCTGSEQFFNSWNGCAHLIRNKLSSMVVPSTAPKGETFRYRVLQCHQREWAVSWLWIFSLLLLQTSPDSSYFSAFICSLLFCLCRDNSKKKDVRIMNIEAAKSVADAVRTSLGPRGMDKMVREEAEPLLCFLCTYTLPVYSHNTAH